MRLQIWPRRTAVHKQRPYIVQRICNLQSLYRRKRSGRAPIMERDECVWHISLYLERERGKETAASSEKKAEVG
jgi:hypothetical protein